MLSLPEKRLKIITKKNMFQKKKNIHIREEYNVQNQKRGFC